jgi:hypothetical protein
MRIDFLRVRIRYHDLAVDVRFDRVFHFSIFELVPLAGWTRTCSNSWADLAANVAKAVLSREPDPTDAVLAMDVKSSTYDDFRQVADILNAMVNLS